MYDHLRIEKKWQDYWLEEKTFKADDFSRRPKFYCLDMFPYPSGAGLHVGHPEGYTATDIVSRYKRMNGFNVLHPMGWDAFGLPAENYAIKEGVHPAESTAKNIKTFKRQIMSLGFSYDWDREINTSAPDYYKWTQWLFLQLYKNSLAYKGKAPVNWCEHCQTVLANEQVEEGRCERCKNPVVRRELEQWFFKITKYADELLANLGKIDWPEPIKLMQNNWIGKSEGGQIDFVVAASAMAGAADLKIKVFTTRPDTLFGATYLVLAPEHEAVLKIVTPSQLQEVKTYQEHTARKSELERIETAKDKTGVFTGAFAINPATGEKIPVWIADYVLATYGTGAIMAVPAHDDRDFEFATKYKLPIKYVVRPEKADAPHQKAYLGPGVMTNSPGFDGLPNQEAKSKILKKVGGKKVAQFRIRDWLVSRQRYWGAPIPIIYCVKCGMVTVPEKDLPVLLPDDVDFRPTGESPLARSEKFHRIKCPQCDGPARRESDTMDTFVCSSWYYFRYTDPHNKKEAFDKKNLKYWMPVDLYIGGAEHAAGHLIFSRFVTKFLRDQKYLKFDEPFLKLYNQGLILAEDGRKMSKSLGNVINPDEVVNQYGADTMRMYEMFMGPLDEAKPWSTQGIKGVRRFLDKVYGWLTSAAVGEEKIDESDLPAVHKLIKKISNDIENFRFNTAVSAFMIFVNEMGERKTMPAEMAETFLKLLYPFAPHMCEELWQFAGHKKSLQHEAWPKYDSKLIKDEQVTLIIQVNGKLRDKLTVSPDIKEKEAVALAQASTKIARFLEGKKVKEKIFVPGRLINFVI